MGKLLKLLCLTLMVLLSCVMLGGCGGDDDNKAKPKKENKQSTATFSNKGMKDPDEVKIKVKDGRVVTLNNQSPYNFRGAQANPKKPFTLMVYVCGTDLEEEGGCASGDIREMAASKFKGENLNVVLLTGGTRKWKTKGIDNTGCNIYTLEGDTLVRQATLGRQLLSDRRTLTTFVNFATNIYPADKYGLVFWDHGGGPVWSYGVDQFVARNGKQCLYVPELNLALANTPLSQKKAEFIGFDACLMATIETAQQLQAYAKYLVASEEAEPGFGWDWRWLKTLSENPQQDILVSLKEIVNRFIAYCDDSSGWIQDFDGTLSIIDMSKANNLAAALNNMGRASNGIFASQQKAVAFERGRAKTKSFGDMGDDGNFDLIDLGDYAVKMANVFPAEAQALQAAVADAVVYQKHSSSVSRSTGVTTYSPYNASVQEARVTYPSYANIYKNVGAISNHTTFLTRLGKCLVPVPASNHKKRAGTKAVKGGMEATLPAEDEAQVVEAKFVLWRELDAGSDYFVRLLVDKDVESKDGKYSAKFAGKLMSFQDEFIYVREKDRKEDGSIVTYDSPAYLNGEKVRVLIRKDADHKDGRILGALKVAGPGGEDSKIASKQILQVKQGDKLQFRYWANLWTKPGDEAKYAGQPTHKWVKGKELTVGDSLELKSKAVGKELYLATFWITEMNANMELGNYYTQKLEMRRK